MAASTVTVQDIVSAPVNEEHNPKVFIYWNCTIA